MRAFLSAMLLVLAAPLLGTAPAWAQPKAAASAPKEITFGMISTGISTASADDYKKRWQPLLEELATQAGVRVNAVASTNIVEDIKNGKIQGAWLSNTLALDAVGTGKMKVLLEKSETFLLRAHGSHPSRVLCR